MAKRNSLASVDHVDLLLFRSALKVVLELPLGRDAKAAHDNWTVQAAYRVLHVQVEEELFRRAHTRQTAKGEACTVMLYVTYRFNGLYDDWTINPRWEILDGPGARLPERTLTTINGQTRSAAFWLGAKAEQLGVELPDFPAT